MISLSINGRSVEAAESETVLQAAARAGIVIPTLCFDPRISPEQRATGNFTNSRAIIDACRPFHWRDKFPPVNMPSPEILKKAREKFSYLLE